jgi:hypothetical protein
MKTGLARARQAASMVYWRVKEVRLATLEAVQRRYKRRVEIGTAFAGLSDDVLRRRMRQYRRAGGGVRVGQADHPGGRRQANDSNDAGATRS